MKYGREKFYDQKYNENHWERLERLETQRNYSVFTQSGEHGDVYTNAQGDWEYTDDTY